jgi:hypothetical protein
MKSFKKYILEEIDRTALPPPTVIYAKDINPEMLDPSELPMYRFNLPPQIDWRALDERFLSLLRLYETLLGILKIYGYVPSTILRQLELAFNLPANSIPDNIDLAVDYEAYVIDTLIDMFHELYPNATQEQHNTFIEQFTQYTGYLDDMWTEHMSEYSPPDINYDLESPRIPRNQPKPNLPKKPFWPGHADGVVG